MMLSVLLIALLVPAALAQKQISNKDSLIQLPYRQNGESLSASLTLNCNGGNGQFEVTLDTPSSSSSSSLNRIELLNKGCRPVSSTSNKVVLSCPLNELSLDVSNKNCDGSSDKSECGASRRGSLEINLGMIRVPGSGSRGSPLYWPPVLYRVEMECRLEAKDPECTPLIHRVPEAYLEMCVPCHHTGRSYLVGPFVTSWERTQRMGIDLRQNAYKFQLDSCVVQTTLGKIVPVMANGQILNVPNGQVSGRAVSGGQDYELDFKDFILPDASTKGVLNCRVAYCRSETDTVNYMLPICPTGDIPRATGGSRLALNLNRSVRQFADLELGSVTLVIAAAPGLPPTIDCE